MLNSTAISAWSIDAFQSLSSNLYKKISVEQISRIETFISAFILFDKVYLTQKYSKNNAVTQLNASCGEVIECIPSEKLHHSDDANDHLSFDIDLHIDAFEKLSKEHNKWHYQNDPDLGYAIYFSKETKPEIQDVIDSKFFTNFRLWQWCLVNEMAELTESICMLPMSLEAISEFAIKKREVSDMVLKRYIEYAKYHNQKFVKFSEVITTPFISELKYIPPLFSLFLDKCKNSEDSISVLAKLREEYSEFQTLRHKFTHAITQAKTISEQSDIISDWNNSWRLLTVGEFKKQSLLRKKISSTDISSSIVSIETGTTKTIVKNFIDYIQYKKAYNLFRIFSNVNSDIGNMNTESALLHSKFGVKEIIPLVEV